MGDIVTNVDMVVSAQDRATPTFEKVAAAANAARAAAEKGDGGGAGGAAGGGSFASKLKAAQTSDTAAGLKGLGKLLKGGGAFLGIKLIAGELSQFASKVKEASDSLRDGTISGGEFVDKLAGSLPIIGQVWEAGRSIHKLFDDPEGDLKREQDRSKAIDNQNRQLLTSQRAARLATMEGRGKDLQAENDRHSDAIKKIREERAEREKNLDALKSTAEGGGLHLQTAAVGLISPQAARMVQEQGESQIATAKQQLRDLENARKVDAATEENLTAEHNARIFDLERSAAVARTEFALSTGKEIARGRADFRQQQLREAGKDAEADRERITREAREKADAIGREANKLAEDDQEHARAIKNRAQDDILAVQEQAKAEIEASERKAAHAEAERVRTDRNEVTRAQRESIVAGLRSTKREADAALAEIQGVFDEKLDAIDHDVAEKNRKLTNRIDDLVRKAINVGRGVQLKISALGEANAGRADVEEAKRERQASAAAEIQQGRLELLRQESELGNAAVDVEAAKLQIAIRRTEEQRRLTELLKNDTLTPEQRKEIEQQGFRVDALAAIADARVGQGGPASLDSAVVHVQESHHLSGAGQASKEQSVVDAARKISRDVQEMKESIDALVAAAAEVAQSVFDIDVPNP